MFPGCDYLGENDKEARLREVLGASGTPEEALLKRCSHFDLAGSATSAQVPPLDPL
jgi:hypothetical protein